MGIARSNKDSFTQDTREGRHIGRTLLFLLLLVALVLGGYFGLRQVLGSGYSDEESFQKYAGVLIDGMAGTEALYGAEDNYAYGEPLSYASRIPTTECETVDQEVKDLWAGRQKNFAQENRTLGGKNQAAMVLGYEASSTPHEVNGLAIHTFTYRKVDGEETLTEHVDCYNIATKANVSLLPAQIFRGNYEELLREKGTAFLEDTYGDALRDEYGEALLSAKDNFILTQDGIKFFLDAGTVVSEDKGAVSFTIPYEDADALMRDKIGERIIDPTRPMVAITYDDGPSAEITPQLLDLYEKYGVVCTFFELGKNVETAANASDILKRERELGCEVGNHSYSHPNLYTLSDQQIQDQADRSNAAITEASGKAPTIMRAPYGNGSNHICEIFGLPSVNWNIDTMDWSSKDKEKIIESVKSQGNLDGDIILMHSIYKPSLEASQELVPWLIEQGYQLVTVTELLEYKYGHSPVPVKDFSYSFML